MARNAQIIKPNKVCDGYKTFEKDFVICISLSNEIE